VTLLRTYRGTSRTAPKGRWALEPGSRYPSKLNREHAQTFVLVTHDAEVGAACDRIIRMRDGLVRAVELVNDLTPGDVGEAAA